MNVRKEIELKPMKENDLIEVDHRYIQLYKQEPLKNELKDFINSIENKTKPLVTGNDGVEAIRIAEAAIESIRKGEKIEMSSFKVA